MKQRQLFTLVVLLAGAVFLSHSAVAKDYAYRGRVEGMVCAFCAYNVNRKIASVPGIDAQSVNVDLKKGSVEFRSAKKVDPAAVASLFSDSGYKLVALNEVADAELKGFGFSSRALVTLGFSTADIEQIDDVLDSIGSLAASGTSKLSIQAPQASEIDILKPILVGRKNTIKVQFTPSEGSAVQLQVFPAAGRDDARHQ